MYYRKGTHILATFICTHTELLKSYKAFKKFSELEIQRLGLTNLGSVFHDFKPSGFTSVICLSESHLSIHTWPEFNTANFDIYLSSVTKDNSDQCNELFNSIANYFGATVENKQIIER